MTSALESSTPAFNVSTPILVALAVALVLLVTLALVIRATSKRSERR